MTNLPRGKNTTCPRPGCDQKAYALSFRDSPPNGQTRTNPVPLRWCRTHGAVQDSTWKVPA
jgi:hypothetical protein